MEGSSSAAALANPIINRPYDVPDRHFAIGTTGPTGEVLPDRRPSEFFVPVPTSRKGAQQAAFDFDETRERRERIALVNDLRREVGRWRVGGYNRATAISKKLLTWWASDNRVLFCQREAAETAIFLAEVAGRDGWSDWRRRLDEANAEYNAGLPRIALKMATGSGKTVVMAMLIAWQTANKVQSPRDARFAKRFLVVAPGITIRDRLRVLQPSDDGNYYDERDLLPPDLRGAVGQAQIVIANEHVFDLKTTITVSSTARAILRNGKTEDPFVETSDAMVSRVLRAFGGAREQIVVFNDEAHHCYRDRPLTAKLSKDEQDANATARRWFKGLQAVQRKLGIKVVYDLSATPFFLGGSGYTEGYIFPWVVSDFSLMDAIESGVVKIPRLPVDDDATGDLVTYLRLWDHIGKDLPKRRPQSWYPPKELEGALTNLYTSYLRAFTHWRANLESRGEPPPVFIVVCPNTVVSRLVNDWIAAPDSPLHELRNAEHGAELTRPRTILVDSAQLESGEAIKGEFKDAAATEIEAFKTELRRRRDPGVDPDRLTDEDLLREVMNSVGKKGRLGSDVRCVVSVAMLTEGWDANTVTHILGIRAFGSQLLCEQVVGRGLRRRSYSLTDDGYFEPEYANVYGIPFAFIPSDRVTAEPPPRPPAALVQSLPERAHLRIEFPRLDGYRVEIPDEPLIFDPEGAPRFVIGPSTVPTRTDVAGIVGQDERVTDDPSRFRPQQVAFALAKRLLHDRLVTEAGDTRPWQFPQVVDICRSWLTECVDIEGGYSIGHLMLTTEWQFEAVEAIERTITRVEGARERLRPMLRTHQAVGSTAEVSFVTRKPLESTEKSEISHVTLDGVGGNTWEQLMAGALERDSRVHSYVKNDHLGFEIPYVHKGRTHAYVPDFLVRLDRRPGDVERTLVVEVSGGQKSPGPTRAKAETARNQWCPAVNNHGGFGRWGYIEVKSMEGVRDRLAEAIDLLYADAPITGDPDLLDTELHDYRGRHRGAA